MPFSILLQGHPTSDVPAAHVQGPALQGMFLHLMGEVDPALKERLHHEDNYRPYTLSPLGIGTPNERFAGFRLPRHEFIRRETPCYVRITMLVDDLFPVFGRYFLERSTPTFRLGTTEFVVTSVLDEHRPSKGPRWTQYFSYTELLNMAAHTRKITLRFLTPTSFGRGDVDLPLPIPRLVFQSYLKRFQEFHAYAFLSDLLEQIDFYTGIARLDRLRTDKIKTKRVMLRGFVGEVSFEISKKAPPELIRQMHVLADFAFYCGTGKKTTVGMGQTIRVG